MQRINAADRIVDSHLPVTDTNAFVLQRLNLLRDNGHPLLNVAQAEFAARSFTCITGPSGSGKSSLLLAMAGLNDRYTGQILCHYQQGGSQHKTIALSESSSSALLNYRDNTVGMVFQEADLLVELTAFANASVAAAWALRADRQAIDNRARQVLTSLGITQHNAPAGKLSGGEQQRVAIARALARQPEILLADEPTASLDEHNAQRVLDVLLSHTVTRGGTLIVCSHDPLLMQRADHLWHLENGIAKCVRSGALAKRHDG